MGRKTTTNIASDGAVVGIQCGTSKDDHDGDVEVTNIASEGSTVGVQGGHMSGVTVVINGETVVS